MAQVYRIVFCTAAAFAFVMATLPQPPQLPGSPSDKIQHILAFATLAGLGYLAYPSASLMCLLAGLSIFGAVIEMLQAIPRLNRDSDVIDWVADTFAAALVLAAVPWWRRGNDESGRR